MSRPRSKTRKAFHQWLVWWFFGMVGIGIMGHWVPWVGFGVARSVGAMGLWVCEVVSLWIAFQSNCGTGTIYKVNWRLYSFAISMGWFIGTLKPKNFLFYGCSVKWVFTIVGIQVFGNSYVCLWAFLWLMNGVCGCTWVESSYIILMCCKIVYIILMCCKIVYIILMRCMLK